MENTGSVSISDRAATVISIIFHPLLIPVYGMVIILTAPTLYNYIPFDVKKLIVLIILVNNVLLPLSLIPFFVHRNFISSWSITERKDRNIPLIMSTILYIITTYILFRFPIPYFLKTYFLAVAFLSLAATVVNFWWKISLHSIGSGMLLALVLVLSFKMYTPLVWFLVPAILISGIIMSSRLYMNLHNPQQIWTGCLTGFLGFSVITMLI
jgi:hypothetical protein